MAENRSKSVVSNQDEVGRAPAFYDEEAPRSGNHFFDTDSMPGLQGSGSKYPTSDNNEEEDPSDSPSPEEGYNGDGASDPNHWFQFFNQYLYQLQPVFVDTAEFLEESMAEMSNVLDG